MKAKVNAKVASAAIAVLLVSLTAAAKPNKPNKKQQEQLAIERHEWMAQYYLRRANDLDGAAKEYKAILALDAKNVAASLALASIYMHAKKQKEAIEVGTRLTRQSPRDPQGWLLLAELDTEAGNDAGMKAAVEKLLALDPVNVDAYELLFASAEKRLHAGDASAKPEALANRSS